MIITDKFVMINFPKTGSTFVRNVLKKLHTDFSLTDRILFKYGLKNKPYFENLWLPNIRDTKYRKSDNDEHGIYCQIPEEHKNKIIVSVKRNLFERYISVYEYGFWKKSPPMNPEILRKHNNNFPNLSFEEFVRLWTRNNPLEKHSRINRKLPIGPASSQFILFYFKNPFDILNKIDVNYINSDDYMQDMAEVIFLNQKELNSELVTFLSKIGYDSNKINFINNENQVNVSRPKNKTIDDYYSNELIEYVKEKEKFLFRIFKDYCV